MSVSDSIITRAAQLFKAKLAEGNLTRKKCIHWATKKAFLDNGIPYPPYRDKLQVYSKLGKRGSKVREARRVRERTLEMFPETIHKA